MTGIGVTQHGISMKRDMARASLMVVGASVKRRADRLVLQGKDIINAGQLFQHLQNSDSAIKVYNINEETVEQSVQMLYEINVPTVPGTMTLHQVLCEGGNKEIRYREVSCVCRSNKAAQYPYSCDCYKPKVFKFTSGKGTGNGDQQINKERQSQILNNESQSKNNAQEREDNLRERRIYFESLLAKNAAMYKLSSNGKIVYRSRNSV